jgi:UDP-N-acetylmuramoyl-L-alanyl-D-glutamate--2,6-diaminopimelate ligase
LAFLGAVWYGFPSRKLKVIGITGTNGKSTTAEMIVKIFEEACLKTALLSSIRFKIGEKEWQNKLKMTMPGRFFVQRFLRQAVKAGCQYAVLEVTSEGVLQYRHKFIDFEAAVFTNLTPEHIEAHGSFENYRAAKGTLFKATKKNHIINADDNDAEYFLQFPAEKKYLYQIKEQKLRIKIIDRNSKILKNMDVTLNLKLPGEFNVYNSLAAICVGLSQGFQLTECKKAVQKIEVIPGRMEEVISKPFKVIVDYAFTPNALEKVYQTIKKDWHPKRLICVLGACGGGRDRWKRKVLGGLAAKYCNEIIVTNEDPYDEDPMAIIDQVAKGSDSKAKKILDRREAIRESLKNTKKGDVVIITGKGSESWICVAKGKKIPWDDRQVVREEMLSMDDIRT